MVFGLTNQHTRQKWRVKRRPFKGSAAQCRGAPHAQALDAAMPGARSITNVTGWPMHYIDSLLPTLEHLHTLGYWLVLLVAFLESMAFVGVIIPGTTLVLFAGSLAAQGYYSPVGLFWFATAGAMLGDGLSFWLGQHGTGLFKESNRFFKPRLLDKGNDFFEKYGPKSIFLGRFVGPVRMLVPFVAGLAHMPSRRFYFWNIISAFAWSSSHILAGYLLGRAWKVFEVWTDRAGIILGVLILLVGGVYWIKRLRRLR